MDFFNEWIVKRRKTAQDYMSVIITVMVTSMVFQEAKQLAIKNSFLIKNNKNSVSTEFFYCNLFLYVLYFIIL